MTKRLILPPLPRAAEDAWVPWLRELPLPARATGRFMLPLSTFAAGAHRWHVVLTEPGTYRRLAYAASTFAVEP